MKPGAMLPGPVRWVKSHPTSAAEGSSEFWTEGTEQLGQASKSQQQQADWTTSTTNLAVSLHLFFPLVFPGLCQCSLEPRSGQWHEWREHQEIPSSSGSRNRNGECGS